MKAFGQNALLAGLVTTNLQRIMDRMGHLLKDALASFWTLPMHAHEWRPCEGRMRGELGWCGVIVFIITTTSYVTAFVILCQMSFFSQVLASFVICYHSILIASRSRWHLLRSEFHIVNFVPDLVNWDLVRLGLQGILIHNIT